ncbi:zinc-dependent alcohol dehydrogenase [Alicyclobacillus fastidiosus]|uniref:Alcohol dehydrogenase catalytic domain-containing protein n=1 Tax=Alicyclobacillus fastidiosus TaxID=392011 RepID=A0ABV5AJ63_9BACL|nr:alcohol dehydrogenase catalytic domain-containing protein [Alicyclobacillus fastidiosus]WEH11597.1 alcohol dehydrogenase catalytic domain-containing protein [Alicyclobacillus fastidiosus]
MRHTSTSMAAVAIRNNETQIQELDLPELSVDDGLLKVEMVGMCGTDVGNYSHITRPTILGHHVVGHIEKIGELAAERWGVKEGDRVAMEEYLPCGTCEHCREGLFRACKFTDSRRGGMRYGNTALDIKPGLWGGFSQYMYLHPNAVVHKMPTHVPAAEAVFTLPLANGFEWMCLEAGVGIGKTVVVLGPGQQGMACVLAAKAAGAQVIVVGRQTSVQRLALCQRLGADAVVNTTIEDPIERIAQITGGKLADVVIDVTSGGTELVTQSFAMVKSRGLVILAAYKYAKVLEWDSDLVLSKSITVKGLRGHSYGAVEMAIQCISAGRFPISILHSHNFGLLDVDSALRTAAGTGEPNPLLVSVSPWQ